MKTILLFLKGVLVGIGNMIAGISGGTIAYITGIYQDLIDALSNIRSKKNILFLLIVGIGIVIGIVLSALLLNQLFTYLLLETLCLFFGFILAGVINDIPNLKLEEDEKKYKYVIAFIIPFIIVIGLSFLNLYFTHNNIGIGNEVNDSFFYYLYLFVCAFIAAFAMMIPGISGSLILMIMGVYYPILNTISGITNFELYSFKYVFNIAKVVLPIGLGIILSLLTMSKPIKYFFNKYNKLSLYVIMGFVVASLFAIFIVNIEEIIFSFTYTHLLYSLLVFLPLGFLISFFIYKMKKMKENQV